MSEINKLTREIKCLNEHLYSICYEVVKANLKKVMLINNYKFVPPFAVKNDHMLMSTPLTALKEVLKKKKTNDCKLFGFQFVVRDGDFCLTPYHSECFELFGFSDPNLNSFVCALAAVLRNIHLGMIYLQTINNSFSQSVINALKGKNIKFKTVFRTTTNAAGDPTGGGYFSFEGCRYPSIAIFVALVPNEAKVCESLQKTTETTNYALEIAEIVFYKNLYTVAFGLDRIVAFKHKLPMEKKRFRNCTPHGPFIKKDSKSDKCPCDCSCCNDCCSCFNKINH